MRKTLNKPHAKASQIEIAHQ